MSILPLSIENAENREEGDCLVENLLQQFFNFTINRLNTQNRHHQNHQPTANLQPKWMFVIPDNF